ncbi:MAG: hypothetical protein E2O88_07600 [Bacteroidetes bacterium]|nr:MAG: hypothetical protein E2O88_07600 [Bacteroidota bacterium]
MKKIYLHIGTHKTGTTALQFFLWNNRIRLKELGFLYPTIGLGGGYSHGVLANIIKPNNQDDRLTEYKNEFNREIGRSDAPNILLSSEVFLEGLNIASSVRQFVDQDAFDVIIIVYLRNQVDWLQSVFNEVIRDPYRRFTGDIFQLREYQQQYHDYERILEPWVKHFGDDAIVVRPYGNFRYKNAIFHDFLNTVGIKDLDSFNYDVKNTNENIRLHPLATEFLRRANRFAMMQDEYCMVVDELSRISTILADKYGKNYITITPETKNEIVEKFEVRNRELFRRYAGLKDMSLFESMKRDGDSISSQSGFGAEVQHFIIDNMKTEVRQFLEMLVDSIKNRKEGKPFLRVPPVNNEDRLNEVILRQRLELRKIYEILREK